MSGSTPEAVPPQLESRLSTIRARARTSAKRILGVGLVATAVLTAAAYVLADARRERLDVEALEDLAVPAATGLSQRIRANLEVLRGTAAFVDAVEAELTPERFRAFTQARLERHPAVYALEWAPRVEGADRAAFEAATGPDFSVLEPRSGGGLRPAPERPYYYPILFEEPHGGAIGLDLAFEPTRRENVLEAVESGEIASSAPFALAERPGREDYVALYLAVTSPPGVAVLVLDRQLLFSEWRASIGEDDIYVWFGQLREEREAAPASALRWEKDISLGSMTLPLGLAVPRGFGGGGPLTTTVTVAVLLLGLFSTGVAWALDRVRHLHAEVDKAKELGQYVVERKLGQGAMGVVFLARHALMKRPTALKLMLSQDEKSIRRFEREVQLSCQLSHPNVVQLYDFGRTEDGIFYYAMEYLPGLDLHTLVLEEGTLSDGRAVHFLLQLARGLREAHAAGLVHRDIKPGNLHITRVGTQADVLKVLDFGLVKPVEEADAPDRGRIVGTPLYMAPEAIRTPDEVGPAADVYAVGCVAYHMLSGRPPFVGRNIRAILDAHLTAEPPSLTALAASSVTAELEALIAQCLDKEPAARPTDDELVDRLSRMPVVEAWSDWDAAEWWARRSAGPAASVGDTTSLHEVTVVARRPALD